MIAWHVTALQVRLCTDYSRRPGWVRWLIRQRNRFIPWPLWDIR